MPASAACAVRGHLITWQRGSSHLVSGRDSAASSSPLALCMSTLRVIVVYCPPNFVGSISSSLAAPVLAGARIRKKQPGFRGGFLLAQGSRRPGMRDAVQEVWGVIRGRIDFR
jgi:hypothetical protein